MQATYNIWLVALSIIVAIVVSYTALTLAGRVAQAERSSGRGWLFGGAAAMGIGIWSMHFIGMLAFSVPIPAALQHPDDAGLADHRHSDLRFRAGDCQSSES